MKAAPAYYGGRLFVGDYGGSMNAVDAQTLMNNIAMQNVGDIRRYPGMIATTVHPETSVADALRQMDRIHVGALLVSEDGFVKGMVEREHLANALLLKLFEHSGK